MSIEDDFAAFRRVAGEEIAKLREEIAELRAHAERVGEANDRLLVENAALQGDKERLDWLTNTGCWLTFPVLSKHHNWKHGTARDVIDLARKESE